MDKMNNDVVAAQLREWSRLLGTCQRSDQAYWQVLAGMNEVADDLSPPTQQVTITVTLTRHWSDDADYVFERLAENCREFSTILREWQAQVLAEFNTVKAGCAMLVNDEVQVKAAGSIYPTIDFAVRLDFTHTLGDVSATHAIQEVFYDAGVAGDFVICSSTEKERA
jgi:hypothetical protein